MFKIAGGFVLLASGFIMLVVPGPGLLTIALGLAMLATEFNWARRWLKRMQSSGTRLRDMIVRFSSSKTM